MDRWTYAGVSLDLPNIIGYSGHPFKIYPPTDCLNLLTSSSRIPPPPHTHQVSDFKNLSPPPSPLFFLRDTPLTPSAETESDTKSLRTWTQGKSERTKRETRSLKEMSGWWWWEQEICFITFQQYTMWVILCMLVRLRSHNHPSYPQISRLLSTSLSLGHPFPRSPLCVQVRLLDPSLLAFSPSLHPSLWGLKLLVY